VSMSSSNPMQTDLGVDQRSMARGAAVNLGGSLVAIALGFGVGLALTHIVTARAIGLVALGTTVVGLAMIPAVLGLDTGVIRFVARTAALDDERGARAATQAALFVATLSSSVLTVALWLSAPWICERFFHKPFATDVVQIVALSLPALTLARVASAASQGFGLMRYSAWVGIVRRPLRLLALLPFLAVGLDARTLAVATVIAAWIGCLISLVFLLRVHTKVLSAAKGAWPFRALLSFSIPQVLTGLLFSAILWTDTLLLGRYRSAADVGVYTIVGTLLGPATIVSTAVGQMFAPRVSIQDAKGDRPALAAMLKRVTHWNTAVSFPFFAVLVLIPTALLTLFGSRYAAGASALAILAAGQFFNTAAGPLGLVINMSGRQYLTMTNNALVAALNIVSCVFLIPRYGLAGAAISTASALTLVNVIKLIEVRLLFGIHPFGWYSTRILFAAAGSVAATLPLAVLPSWQHSLVEIAVCGSVLIAVYGTLTWALALTPEDRELLAQGQARLRRRFRGPTLAPGG
jgi:O-antigen/teichoic acid export membrane protein